MHIHAYPSGSHTPLIVPLQALQSFYLGAFMCKISFPFHLAPTHTFLEKLYWLLETVTMSSDLNARNWSSTAETDRYLITY